MTNTENYRKMENIKYEYEYLQQKLIFRKLTAFRELQRNRQG